MAENETSTFSSGGGSQNGSSTPNPMDRTISMTRRLYTTYELDRVYQRHDKTLSHWDTFKSNCACSFTRVVQIVLGYLPFIGMLRHYKWRSDFITDLMAGICVSFLQLPQGLALGLLASLPPVYGLYTTFFPTVFYLIFGTSRHTSLGTNAVIALLTATFIQSHMDKLSPIVKPVSTGVDDITTDPSVTVSTSPFTTDDTLMLFEDSDQELEFRVGVATTIAFLSGIFLTVAGLLKLGFVTKYLSTSFIGGFTTATAIHILTSQVPKLLNIHIKPHSGAGKIIKTYIDVFENIGDANPADIIISVISLAFLLLTTIFVNERFKDKLKVPVPIQLILVIISTIISYVGHFERDFGVAVVGDVASGLQSPSIPDPGAYPGILYDSALMAILMYVISISLAKLTAKMHNDDLDDNQEFLAYGLTNTFSSFFGCFTSCNAPPRAMILSAVGAKTTLHNIFCAIFILIVLLVAGSLFTALPIAVLAAMICAALKNILLQVTQLPFIWRSSKPDWVIWVVTFLTSVFLDLDYGIISGIAISFVVVVVKSQFISGTLGAVSTSEDIILRNGNKRSGMKSSDQFVIFYFPAQLYFANVENFKKDLFSNVFNPRELLLQDEMSKLVNNGEDKTKEGEEDTNDDKSQRKGKRLKYIILECSAMTYVDLDGARMLKDIAILYKKVGVSVLLSNCPDYLLDLIESVGYFRDIPKGSVYFDVFDATVGR